MANTYQARECLVVHADEMPVISMNLHKQTIRYKNPRLSVENRSLGLMLPDYLRVQMIYAGICGTDLHIVKSDSAGFVLTTSPLQIPFQGRVLGHEGVGRVLSVGDGISNFRPGDIVGMESIVTCQSCDSCRRGQFNQCLDAQLIGLERDGLFSTFVDIPASIAHNCNAITKDEDGMKAAACLEPAGVAWLACERSAISGGDRVLIFGAGPLGYYCAMLTRLVFGASWVGIVDPVVFRREHAGRWCDDIFDVSDDRIEHLNIDVVVEASGVIDNIQRVIAGVKPNGRIVLLGRGGQPLRLDVVDDIITKGITLLGVRGHLGGAFGRIITLYQAKRLPLSSAVTNVIESLYALEKDLIHSEHLINQNCKVLVTLI